jgi:hypothetical protein
MEEARKAYVIDSHDPDVIWYCDAEAGKCAHELGGGNIIYADEGIRLPEVPQECGCSSDGVG